MGKPVPKRGLEEMVARVSTHGLECLDKRSSGYIALKRWQDELIADLGGEESLSAQEKALVEAASRTWLFLSTIDMFLLQNGLMNKKKRSAYPLVATRSSMMNSLVNLLSQLGLKRREKEVPSLAEYLAEKAEGSSGEHFAGDERPGAISEDVCAAEEVAVEDAGG